MTAGASASGSTAPDGHDSAAPDPARVQHRPAWLVFVVLGAVFCVGMGVWQLARYQEASGTVQNLGYTFMWPFLGWFLFYAYFKYLRLEAEERADLAAETDAARGGTAGGGDEIFDDDTSEPTPHHPFASASRAPGSGRRRVMTEIPEDLLPTRRPPHDDGPRDEGLEAYNSYLAELARRDGVGDRSQEKPAS